MATRFPDFAADTAAIGTDASVLDAAQHPPLRGVTADGHSAVVGVDHGAGALGALGGRDPEFNQAAGVYGQSPNQGVFGRGVGDASTGVYGHADGSGTGVRGESLDGAAVQGQCFGAGRAARFIGAVDIEGDLRVAGRVLGDLAVTGDIQLLGADCAENFDLGTGAQALPGMAMVIDDEGAVRPCTRAYDRRVAGIVSGAGSFRPGVVLHARSDAQACAPLALVGKVYCRVDASQGAVAVGDLLTTSTTPGHAMKASNAAQAFGAILGKALGALPEGRGLVPVLVVLH